MRITAVRGSPQIRNTYLKPTTEVGILCGGCPRLDPLSLYAHFPHIFTDSSLEDNLATFAQLSGYLWSTIVLAWIHHKYPVFWLLCPYDAFLCQKALASPKHDIQTVKRLKISAFWRRKPSVRISCSSPPFQLLYDRWLLSFSQNADGLF